MLNEHKLQDSTAKEMCTMWSHQSATYHERFETFGKRRLPTVWTSEAWNCPGVTCTSSPCVHFSCKFMSTSDCSWPSCSPSLQCLLAVGELETQPTQPMYGEASFPWSLVQRSLEVLEVWVIHLDESNLKDKSQAEQTLHWKTRLRYSWCKLSGLQAGFAENWNNSDVQVTNCCFWWRALTEWTVKNNKIPQGRYTMIYFNRLQLEDPLLQLQVQTWQAVRWHWAIP